MNVDAGFYQFYVGGEQIQKGKLHNLYFRLHERSTTGKNLAVTNNKHRMH